MKGVTVIDHPLVQHHLTALRAQGTRPEEFRRTLARVATLMACEVFRSLPVRATTVSTPLAKARGARLRGELLLVPILRAGLGLLDGILDLVPQARVGFVGAQRDEKTLRAGIYHKSLPDELSSFEILLIDPMLATGGSAVAALGLIAARGGRRIQLMSLVAAPEGIGRVHKLYPELPIFTAAVDECLNQKGYIVPGLGDAGDRLFGV